MDTIITYFLAMWAVITTVGVCYYWAKARVDREYYERAMKGWKKTIEDYDTLTGADELEKLRRDRAEQQEPNLFGS